MLAGQKERRWRVFWDTVYFDEASMPRQGYTKLDVRAGPFRMFTDCYDGSPKTNCYCAGYFPAGYGFSVTEIGVRADLDGPCAEDALHAVLRSMQLELYVGNKECATIPPGGFYPPGLTINRDTLLAVDADRSATSDGLPSAPLALEPAPPWLHGGFCRLLPIKPAITIVPQQNYHVLLRFDGSGLRLLKSLQAEGLLRGELAVLLNGLELRDIL
jgi:hypothetical protein